MHEVMENQSLHTHMERLAPASLLADLEERIEQYDSARTREAHMNELQHTQWEVRCAAVEYLGALGRHAALTILLEALSDEHYLVRMAAIKTLGQFGAQTPVAPLLNALQDPNWQVREMAVLTLGTLEHIPVVTLQAIKRDTSKNVREAVALVQHQCLALPEHMPDLIAIQGRKPIYMETAIQYSTPAEEKASSEQPVILSQRPGKPRGKRQWGLLLVAALLALVILTAAGVNTGWWNTLFGGNAALYQAIEQQQTDQGITIIVRRAYADEGRTVIVYDMTINPAVRLFVAGDTLTASVPQKTSIMQGTSCSAPDNGVKHCYATSPTFLVPRGIQTLRLTWDISRLLVAGSQNQQTLAGFHIETVHYESGSSDTFVVGHWHFSFSVPFHHENRKDMPDPLS